ncbi:MAG: phosphoribosyl-AMP cyclohydrolase [Pirellulaceae bacterium]
MTSTTKLNQSDLPSVPDFSRSADGLLPAIAQDEQTGRVLMLAWMNRQAWEETLQTKQATYWSRSRRKLWRKGESSGHRQQVVDIRIDCDADTILLIVRQTGAACHDGFASCFYRRVDENGEPIVVESRLVDPADVYTARGLE